MSKRRINTPIRNNPIAISKAASLGRWAFMAGLRRVLADDEKLVELLATLAPGEGEPVIVAWLNGWNDGFRDAANRAPVKAPVLREVPYAEYLAQNEAANKR